MRACVRKTSVGCLSSCCTLPLFIYIYMYGYVYVRICVIGFSLTQPFIERRRVCWAHIILKRTPRQRTPQYEMPRGDFSPGHSVSASLSLSLSLALDFYACLKKNGRHRVRRVFFPSSFCVEPTRANVGHKLLQRAHESHNIYDLLMHYYE